VAGYGITRGAGWHGADIAQNVWRARYESSPHPLDPGFSRQCGCAADSELCALAAEIKAPQFELAIDCIDYWPHNRIVWAGPVACPDELRGLVALLEGALQIRDSASMRGLTFLTSRCAQRARRAAAGGGFRHTLAHRRFLAGAVAAKCQFIGI